jgi:hypothetical protein
MPRRRGGYVPHRLVILERFGAAVYTYLFRRAQKRSSGTRDIMRIAREYLAAGGTTRGLRQTIAHVQRQAGPLLCEWYEIAPHDPLRTDALADTLVGHVERR